MYTTPTECLYFIIANAYDNLDMTRHGGSYTPTGGNQQLESSVGDGGGDNSSWMAAINTMGNWNYPHLYPASHLP